MSCTNSLKSKNCKLVDFVLFLLMFISHLTSKSELTFWLLKSGLDWVLINTISNIFCVHVFPQTWIFMDFCVVLVHNILKLVLVQLSSLTECLAIFRSDFVNVYLANLFNPWDPLQILNMVNTFKMHLFCIYFAFILHLDENQWIKCIWNTFEFLLHILLVEVKSLSTF